MSYLDSLPNADHDKIIALQQEQTVLLNSAKKGVERFRRLSEQVRDIRADFCDPAGDVVRIGRAAELSAADRERVLATLQGFMPWRKGPFNVFGIDIDAEWRSERKWRRVLPALPELRDKVVADIGCSNGYYMFRMAAHGPRLVVGLEPYLQHYFAFRTLNGFAGFANLVVEPLGVEHIALYRGCFDVVFLMGILYHRVSPVEVLRDIHAAMRPAGVLIVESQGIPGNEPVALFPEKRYAKVPGTYFVPTAACLGNWLIRAGFVDVEVFCTHAMSGAEQRRTAWMTFESYDDFIDPDNPALTVEGYPAPIRVFIKARRPEKA